MILIGDITRLEDNMARVSFTSINKNGTLDVSLIPNLEQYIIPGIRITYDTVTKKVEVPIVKWRENNRIKLISFTLP